MRINKEYKSYLSSPEWKSLSLKIKQRDNFSCAYCGSNKRLHTHHLTYQNIFNEKDDDLITVCNKCHIDIHKLNNCKDNYFMVFISASDILGRLTKVEGRLFSQLNKHSIYNTNTVRLNKYLRNHIANSMNVKYQSLLNATSKLKKMGIIIIKNGTLIINPQFSWKGEMREREKVMESYQFGLGNILNNIDCR